MEDLIEQLSTLGQICGMNRKQNTDMIQLLEEKMEIR
nr:MAG TPA: hypothetical protein [Caudoviricetes sp.]